MSMSPRPTRDPGEPGASVTVLRPRPRIAPTPGLEPAHDAGDPGSPGGIAPATQGTLALHFTLPSGVPASPAAWLRLVPPPVRASPHRPAQRPLPDPRDWAATVAQAVVEVLAGERPVTQLLHWATPPVYARLARRAAFAPEGRPGQRRAAPRTVVRRVHVCLPADGVVEATTVIHGPRQARALAFRLEEIGGRWLCTALDLV